MIKMVMGREVGDYFDALLVSRLLDFGHIIGINNYGLLRCLIHDEIRIVVIAHRYVDNLSHSFSS